MKKILVTGSTGMLGAHFVRKLRAFDKYEVYGLSRTANPALPKINQLIADISAPLPETSLNYIPDVIIHTAAVTDLNLCEKNPDFARSVNVEGSRQIAQLGSVNTVFFYISTDSVFDGNKGNYSETDQPNPVNSYARSKLEGEQAVSEAHRGKICIIRTNIYGFHVPHMKNSLAEWAFKEWSAGKKISGFTDTVFNAVYTGQLVSAIKFMIDHDIYHPVLNIACDEAISKFDFLQRFRNKLGVNHDLLTPALSADFPTNVVRPMNTSLNTALLSSFYEAPDFAGGIHDWIDESRRIMPQT